MDKTTEDKAEFLTNIREKIRLQQASQEEIDLFLGYVNVLGQFSNTVEKISKKVFKQAYAIVQEEMQIEQGIIH